MFSILLLAAQAPVVMSYHLPVADEWHHSSRFRCGKTELRIEGVAPAQPTNGATIFVNGRPLRGEGVAALLRDLSRPAVYRFGAQCAQPSGSFVLHIDFGEKPARGDVIFNRGRAYIKNGELKVYRMEESNNEAFWFR